ncbi:alpha/beta hydrolase [Nocardia sp. NBC_00565]|uniref:alpha/beta fold hydrolase n=1 Tax=Nocardia sp. NBC_00565 TaxID=2975993 RepID=UPI002E801BD1|nr:alpha/beta hydrolase [Nocardia sp. NBC_00565]WUC02064.1 alpha/beta hydrolase [Nocardia sp. NBC_00565]
MTFPKECTLAVSTPDGVRLSAKRFGTGRAQTSVIFVHGLLTDSTYWAPLAEHLTSRLGDTVDLYLYDQRGHGNSGWPHRRATTTLATMAADLDAIVSRVAGRVILVAHSAGSLVAQAFAEHHPRQFRELAAAVLFSPAGEFPEYPALPSYFLSIPNALSGPRPGALDALNVLAHRALQARFRRLSRRYGSRSPFVTGRHNGDPRVLCDFVHALRHFYLGPQTIATLRAVPTVVLGAERDGVVPASQSARLADKIEADFELATGVGHSLPHADPIRSATAVESTIARVGGPRVSIGYSGAENDIAWGVHGSGSEG